MDNKVAYFCCSLASITCICKHVLSRQIRRQKSKETFTKTDISSFSHLKHFVALNSYSCTNTFHSTHHNRSQPSFWYKNHDALSQYVNFNSGWKETEILNVKLEHTNFFSSSFYCHRKKKHPAMVTLFMTVSCAVTQKCVAQEEKVLHRISWENDFCLLTFWCTYVSQNKQRLRHYCLNHKTVNKLRWSIETRH